MPWYDWFNKKLRPYEKGLDIILLIIAAICIAMVFAPPSVKAGWTVYLLSP